MPKPRVGRLAATGWTGDQGRPTVVLCAPNIAKRPTNTNRLFTLGLLYLRAAAERAGWRCRIVDAYFENLSAEECAVRIVRHDPQLIGYTAPSELMFEGGVEIHRLVERRSQKRLPAVVGGHFPTRSPERALDGHPSFDWIVTGEGEPVFERLLRYLAGHKGDALRAPGLVSAAMPAETGKVPKRLERHIDVFGDYDEDWIEARLAPNEWSLVTSRGCTARCKFCVIGPHWGRYGQWRGHSAAWVAERIIRLRDRGASSVQLVDDQFVGSDESVERAWSISRLLAAEPGLPRLNVMSRPDTVTAHPALFAALRDVGLDTVFLGLETGSDAVAERLRKETPAEVGERAVAILDGLGINVHSGTIVFHPWMSAQTLKEDIRYFRRLTDAYAGFRILALNELDILPGTPLAAEHGAPRGVWQFDWTRDDRPIYEVYRAWLVYQNEILFPLLETVEAAGRQDLAKAISRLQLEALETMLRAHLAGAGMASAFIALKARAARFAVDAFGRDVAVELSVGQSISGGAKASAVAERCFDTA